MAEMFADAIARTAGPCEGPHEEKTEAVWRVCFFVPTWCGNHDCPEQREMIAMAGMSLCQACLDRCKAKTGVVLHMDLNAGTTLEFTDSKVA